jgi:peptide/nickel transport system permease protein
VGKLIINRLIALIPMLMLVSLMVFGLVLLIPGDPAITVAGDNATPEQIELTRERLGLNDPVLVQYSRWIGNVVRGDLGTSLFSNRSVTSAILDRFPVSMTLAFASLLFAAFIAIPSGIIAALKRGTWVDKFFTIGASIGVALPNFWLGLILVLVFALWNPWFPAVGYVSPFDDPVRSLRHLTLPAITLGLSAAAELTRQLRSALIDVLQQDYVRTARAKGLRGRVVIGRHALKNAAVPAITVLGVQVSVLLGGSVIVENVFGIPGLGQLAISSVLAKDVPMIQGIVLSATLIVLFMNLLVDISYGFLNPKVRVQ